MNYATAQLDSFVKARCQHEISDVCHALCKSGLFTRTDAHKIWVVSKNLESIVFPPRYTVDAQRSLGDRLYVIISGKVTVSYRRTDGREIALMILGPSDIFGAITLFDPEGPDIRVDTLTNVSAVAIRRDQLLALMAERPEVSDQLLRLFARWVKDATTSYFADLAFADARSRIARRLLLLQRRFGRQDVDGVRVVHDLSLEDFSSLVAMPSNRVCATLRDFEGRGWIRLENDSFVIVDGEALRSIQRQTRRVEGAWVTLRPSHTSPQRSIPTH